ncbi:MAG TPA: hypothetical protein VGV15_23500 [Terriglobales bacterium]|nr:hypothetical protein [Terriglobales bacterium]
MGHPFFKPERGIDHNYSVPPRREMISRQALAAERVSIHLIDEGGKVRGSLGESKIVHIN